MVHLAALDSLELPEIRESMDLLALAVQLVRLGLLELQGHGVQMVKRELLDKQAYKAEPDSVDQLVQLVLLDLLVR